MVDGSSYNNHMKNHYPMTKIVCLAQLSVKVSKSHLSQCAKKSHLVWNLFLESQKKTAIELLKSCYFFPKAQE
jgi:hypothetical protein